MKTILVCTFSLMLAALSPEAYGQTQKTAAQPPPQTVQKQVAPSKTDAFLKTITSAKSLKEVQDAFQRGGFNKQECEKIQKQIDASSALREKIESLGKAMTASGTQARATFVNRVSTEAKQAEAKENAKNIAEQRRVTDGIEGAYAADARNPEIRCAAERPSISRVVGIRGNEDFVIEGKGFGSEAGIVDVMMGGRVFPASVRKWNSCIIKALLTMNTDGNIRQTAVVSVRTASQKEIRYTTTFHPYVGYEVLEETNWLSGGVFGSTDEFYPFWNLVLKNQWTPVAAGITHSGDGHAEIVFYRERAENNYGAANKVDIQVHAGVAAFGGCTFTVALRIMGPRGVSYK